MGYPGFSEIADPPKGVARIECVFRLFANVVFDISDEMGNLRCAAILAIFRQCGSASLVMSAFGARKIAGAF